jgi:RES domain-containing protein
MLVYRISKKEHSALDGTGGLYGSGRWHRKGNLVVYTSEHASLSAWEKLVHVAGFSSLPDDLILMKIEVPETINIQTVPDEILIKGWNSFPYSNETMDFGTSFLKKKDHLALRVPSAITPDEFNIILNPLHPKIHDCKILGSTPFVFDKRVADR